MFFKKVLVKFTYQSYVYLNAINRTIYVDTASICGGTLINRNTVVTAAHCIPTEISIKWGNRNYQIPVAANQTASMLNVYLGLHFISDLNRATRASVSQVIMVCLIYKHLNSFFELN